MSHPLKLRPLALGLFLLASTGLAHANGFLPTMISANILWFLALPLVVFMEGWLLRRWGWTSPFKASFWANVLSMVAALPVGVGLSLLGAWLVPMRGNGVLLEAGASRQVEFIVGQVLLYGQVSAPAFGFTGGASPMAQVALAALGFMALCWALTVVVEGWYLGRKNPSMGRRVLARKVALMHLISYSALAALWLPYAYWGAMETEQRSIRFCSQALSWSSRCETIWQKFPDAREKRLADCAKNQVEEGRCLKP